MASTVLTKDRDDDSPRPQAAHRLVWEAEKLAEKYILIETCSHRGMYTMHQLERGLGGRGRLAEGLDLALKESWYLLGVGGREGCTAKWGRRH